MSDSNGSDNKWKKYQQNIEQCIAIQNSLVDEKLSHQDHIYDTLRSNTDSKIATQEAKILGTLAENLQCHETEIKKNEQTLINLQTHMETTLKQSLDAMFKAMMQQMQEMAVSLRTEVHQISTQNQQVHEQQRLINDMQVLPNIDRNYNPNRTESMHSVSPNSPQASRYRRSQNSGNDPFTNAEKRFVEACKALTDDKRFTGKTNRFFLWRKLIMAEAKEHNLTPKFAIRYVKKAIRCERLTPFLLSLDLNEFACENEHFTNEENVDISLTKFLNKLQETICGANVDNRLRAKMLAIKQGNKESLYNYKLRYLTIATLAYPDRQPQEVTSDKVMVEHFIDTLENRKVKAFILEHLHGVEHYTMDTVYELGMHYETILDRQHQDMNPYGLDIYPKERRERREINYMGTRQKYDQTDDEASITSSDT